MKTKENTNAKENINAVGNNSKSTAPNAVCWLDVILFEDNTIAVEIYYVDIVYEFKDEFNKHTFTTIKELDDFSKEKMLSMIAINTLTMLKKNTKNLLKLCY